MVLISLPFAKEEQPPEWKCGGDPHKDCTYHELDEILNLVVEGEYEILNHIYKDI
jgi:hypothetical protein